MKRAIKAVAAASALLFFATANAASHRLAYSKAENVEVFVDHAEGTPWCSDGTLSLRFAFSVPPEVEAVERLLPKLGGLLANQCPQAERILWSSLAPDSRVHARGTASAAEGWRASDSIVFAPASLQADAESLPATVAPPPVTPPPPPAPPAATPVPARPAAADFTVAGWKPPAPSTALDTLELFEIRDQNGCAFRLVYSPDTDPRYIVAESSGPRCEADGYARGGGKLTLLRSDGVKLKTFEGDFHHGMPFTAALPDLPPAGVDTEKTLYMLLHAEPLTRTYYLLGFPYNARSGQWNGKPSLAILTENAEAFRNINSIRTLLLPGLEQLGQMMPTVKNVQVLAARDYPRGIAARDQHAWLYAVEARRGKNWDFSADKAKNFLFHAETKFAEQQRQDALRQQHDETRQRHQQVSQAERQLEVYRTIRESLRDPTMPSAVLFTDASYALGGGGSYARMIFGEALPFRQIVHIRGRRDEGWEIDYPYEALLLDGAAAVADGKGWYLTQGKVRLDPERLDAQTLPLTLIDAEALLNCREKNCSDRLDAVTLTRLALEDSAWTPDSARQILRQFRPDSAYLADEEGNAAP